MMAGHYPQCGYLYSSYDAPNIENFFRRRIKEAVELKAASFSIKAKWIVGKNETVFNTFRA